MRDSRTIEKRREAFRLSNDLLHDLISGSSTYIVFQALVDQNPGSVPDDVRAAATRMCLFHVILTLAKWTEFHQRYRDVIPEAASFPAKELAKDIVARGIVDFRNKVVGHVWDKERMRAVTTAEVETRLNSFVGGGAAAFLGWAGNPLAAGDANRPPLVIEAVRDAIQSAYGLTDADLNP